MKNLSIVGRTKLVAIALIGAFIMPMGANAELVKIQDKFLVAQLSAESSVAPGGGLYKVRFKDANTGQLVDFSQVAGVTCTGKKAAIYPSDIGDDNMTVEMISSLRVALIDNFPVNVGFDGCSEVQTNGRTVAKIMWVQLEAPVVPAP